MMSLSQSWELETQLEQEARREVVLGLRKARVAAVWTQLTLALAGVAIVAAALSWAAW